ncbi:9711_t:CDS:10, partial [Ambispora gerdemannii]
RERESSLTQQAQLLSQITTLEQIPTKTPQQQADLAAKKKRLAELLKKKQDSSHTNNAKPSDKTVLIIGCGIVGIVLIGLVLILTEPNEEVSLAVTKNATIFEYSLLVNRAKDMKILWLQKQKSAEEKDQLKKELLEEKKNTDNLRNEKQKLEMKLKAVELHLKKYKEMMEGAVNDCKTIVIREESKTKKENTMKKIEVNGSFVPTPVKLKWKAEKYGAENTDTKLVETVKIAPTMPSQWHDALKEKNRFKENYDVDDPQEKNQEVPKMRQYYGNATVTLVAIHTNILDDDNKELSPSPDDVVKKIISSPWFSHGYDLEKDKKVDINLSEVLREIKNRGRGISIDGIYSILGLLPYGDKVVPEYREAEHKYTKKELQEALFGIMNTAKGSTSVVGGIVINCTSNKLYIETDGVIKINGSDYFIEDVGSDTKPLEERGGFLIEGGLYAKTALVKVNNNSESVMLRLEKGNEERKLSIAAMNIEETDQQLETQIQIPPK